MKTFARTCAFLIVIVFCFALGFGWRDLGQGEIPSSRSVRALFGMHAPTGNPSPEQVFRQTYERILTSYVRPVKPLDLKYAGIEGLMGSLGDPHTVFLPPRAAKAFSDETRANLFGVGARLQPDPLGAKVHEVFEDAPAYQAGMRAGDIITGVNGQSVVGKEIDAIVERVKGPEGTPVRVKLIRQGRPQPFEITIRRARIVIPTVRGKVHKEQGVGVLTIASFSEPTAAQFDSELDKIERQGVKGLIIDVRGNPGGLLESAVELLSRFVENKVVVRMRFRGGDEEIARTFSGLRRDFSYPVVVLIDEDSASAAEIFAGCLKDYGRATLVGEHTYGKSSVQNVIALVDGSSAKITTAKYYLPSGKDIGRKVDEDNVYLSGGLHPDVKVAPNLSGDFEFGDPKKDNQLAKAIQVLREKR